jgi:uncharacterized repeat protein (TIGR03803 family)
VVFKIDPAGNETVLYSFTGGADGNSPNAGLIRDPAGNLYGTTIAGGNLPCAIGDGCGVIFKISPTGSESVLYTFTGEADGASPVGPLLPYKGSLYGTTFYGGANPGTAGFGVVFKLIIP